MATLTPTGRKVLERAAKRERGNICPIIDAKARAAAEQSIVDALFRLGFVTYDGDSARGDEPPAWVTPDADGGYRWGAPRINNAGRAAIA